MKLPVGDILSNALAGMTSGPRPLLKALAFYSEGSSKADLERALILALKAGPNNEIRRTLNASLSRWDWEGNAPWTGSTEPNSPQRRQRIYDLLVASPVLSGALDEYVPAFQGARAVVIDDPTLAQNWYTFAFRRSHKFYWDSLRTFLVENRGINAGSLESSANKVVERLADPSAPTIFRARGLVVGYVQSGKTTNFTAVIAKAIDAGYRLIIVLSGTTNLLRGQTQRRLDMELVGVENILRGVSDEEIERSLVLREQLS